MTKAFKHSGVMMMFGIVALGLLGAAYTLWFEDLSVNITATTGTFDADWSCEEFQIWSPAEAGPNTGMLNDDTVCDETGTANDSFRPTYAIVTGPEANPVLTWYNSLTQGWQPTKVTQTCGAAITTNSTEAGGNDPQDNNQLTLTLNGLYPYTGCEFSIDLHNAGSVPLHLVVADVDLVGAVAPFVRWDVLPGSSPTCQPLIDAIYGYTGTPVYQPVAGVQLHFSDEILCNVRVWVTENNGNDVLPENASGSIGVVIKAHQWNEVP